MADSRYYERKIKYLDLMVNGERVSGAGFVKTEVKGMDVSLAISVKGLHPTDTYERDVVLQAGEGEFAVGRIVLKAGQGEFSYHTVMDYSQLQGIRIVLGGTREICCKWQERTGLRATEKSVKEKAAKEEAAKEVTAPGSSVRDTEISVISEEDTGRERQRRQKKSREIQLIPWDEIKVVEESLERVERIMSNPEESSVWKAVEDDGGAMERERPERQAGASTQNWVRSEERNVTERSGRENIEEQDSMSATDREMPAGQSAVSAAGRARSEEQGAASAMGREMPAGQSAVLAAGRARPEERSAVVATDREMSAGQTAVSAAGRERPEERSAVSATGRERSEGRDAVSAADRERYAVRKNTAERGVKGERGMMARGGTAWEGQVKQRESSAKVVGRSAGREKRPVRLLEDKWQQIWAIYPHIRPFQDEREYLSISPADFVLLSGEAYRAANNSFLLHGYYNYDHLILTKIEKRGEISYYIGVPGNYYEREKQVAVMFGFESFECGTEPAQTGDFGYYMMRTQL